MRTLVTLACTECKRRNYTTTKNKSTMPDRMEIKKYLPLVPSPHAAQKRLASL